MAQPTETAQPDDPVFIFANQGIQLQVSAFDVGIMPLEDSPWEQGKCGYKLIQYMACGKPVIASPVGVNTRIVTPGINDYLAETTRDWVQALTALIDRGGVDLIRPRQTW